jgi:nucleoside-diphosphate kinase
MAVQRTLSLIKPDAVKKNVVGKIISRLEEEGLTPVAMKMMHLSRPQAEGFYHVHKERPFFNDLITFMTEGPILAMVLEGENAIERYRAVMGPTNAEEAPKDTIRGQFGTDIERNACHGSDAPETAEFETKYFFSGLETMNR